MVFLFAETRMPRVPISKVTVLTPYFYRPFTSALSCYSTYINKYFLCWKLKSMSAYFVFSVSQLRMLTEEVPQAGDVKSPFVFQVIWAAETWSVHHLPSYTFYTYIFNCRIFIPLKLLSYNPFVQKPFWKIWRELKLLFFLITVLRKDSLLYFRKSIR